MKTYALPPAIVGEYSTLALAIHRAAAQIALSADEGPAGAFFDATQFVEE